jgi:hypothetical protein
MTNEFGRRVMCGLPPVTGGVIFQLLFLAAVKAGLVAFLVTGGVRFRVQRLSQMRSA